MRNPRTSTRHRSRAAIGLLAAGALFVAACGDDDDDGSPEAADAPTEDEAAQDDAAATDETAAPDDAPADEAPAGESFDVFALLPQAAKIRAPAASRPIAARLRCRVVVRGFRMVLPCCCGCCIADVTDVGRTPSDRIICGRFVNPPDRMPSGCGRTLERFRRRHEWSGDR